MDYKVWLIAGIIIAVLALVDVSITIYRKVKLRKSAKSIISAFSRIDWILTFALMDIFFGYEAGIHSKLWVDTYLEEKPNSKYANYDAELSFSVDSIVKPNFSYVKKEHWKTIMTVMHDYRFINIFRRFNELLNEYISDVEDEEAFTKLMQLIYSYEGEQIMKTLLEERNAGKFGDMSDLIMKMEE